MDTICIHRLNRQYDIKVATHHIAGNDFRHCTNGANNF
ncbi:hypothetical protein AK973_3446 [Pseudomonas brassicacearum]|nr:hypothetical protein AK973_3446 [Pseudomonas brassicacearum]